MRCPSRQAPPPRQAQTVSLSPGKPDRTRHHAPRFDVLQRDQGPVNGNVAGERRRAVDGIDNPAPRGMAFVLAFLLPEHRRVLGIAALAEHGSYQPLGHCVGRGLRTAVGLESRPEGTRPRSVEEHRGRCLGGPPRDGAGTLEVDGLPAHG